MSFEGFPLFRLNSLQILFWLKGGDFRRQITRLVSRTQRTGAVILSPTLRAIATVDPYGNFQELPPPHQKFEMWQICNKPSVKYMECACRNYYDPEVQGPWHLRDKERGMEMHHPHCQFDRTAKPVWTTNYQSATNRVAEKLAPQKRPDEWVKTRQELLA